MDNSFWARRYAWSISWCHDIFLLRHLVVLNCTTCYQLVLQFILWCKARQILVVSASQHWTQCGLTSLTTSQGVVSKRCVSTMLLDASILSILQQNKVWWIIRQEVEEATAINDLHGRSIKSWCSLSSREVTLSTRSIAWRCVSDIGK